MLKVLYYNWTDYRSPRGGGVTVYLRNLLAALSKNEEISPVFLSSGDIYSPFSSQPYIRSAQSDDTSLCPTYELVNSPVPAPGSLLAHNLHSYLNVNDNRVLDLIRQFIINQGGFDVIHFHNIEGLPLNVLKIKEYFPNTKIIFSLHNYFPFCPQVQLFQYHKGSCCKSFKGGLECGRCRNKIISPEWFIEPMNLWFRHQSIATQLTAPWLRYKSSRLAQKLLSAAEQQNNPQIYKDFRHNNISFLNNYTDKILAVSKRVRDIAEDFGITPSLLEVAYIGTDFADVAPLRKRSSDRDECFFTIAYLGYARAAKGFFFLLSALENLPEETSRRMNMRFAARYIREVVNSDRLEQLKKRFHQVEIMDGYQREDLPKILTGVDLGIVPVIWEDNLPQVAIEMAAHGVAVLASDFGGASELSTSPYFRFRGNDQLDFMKRLQFIMKHREILDDYHRLRRPLTNMLQHIRLLQEVYLDSNYERYKITG